MKSNPVQNDAFQTSNSHLQKLNAPCLGPSDNLFIKRDDLIHPVVSGNKWRKLKHHIEAASTAGKKHLVTFGGAFSNHMVATACAGAVLGLKTSCFVRGDELESGSNHFLKLASLYGMNLIPADRTAYRNEKTLLYESHFGNDSEAMMVDEGGAGMLGARGIAEIIFELPFVPDHIIHASATATTAGGLLRGLGTRPGFGNTKVHSIAVLNNSEEQKAFLESLEPANPYEISTDFTFGGYAKTSPELMAFLQEFVSQTGILIDPVYTAKALYALKSKITSGEIGGKETVVFMHTGGMLGLFSEKMIALI